MDRNTAGKRKLSEAEQRRLEAFEKTSDEMIRQGFTRRDLTIDMNKANLFAILLVIPFSVVGLGVYYLVHRKLDFSSISLGGVAIAILALTVVHELIHGACWSIFTPHHFRDVAFGIMQSTFTPYCVCLVPLKKGQHVFGTVMPLILLGIVPMIVGIAIGNLGVLLVGIFMCVGAAGDILIIRMVLGYRSCANEVVYMDHPTDAGGVVFER